MVYIDLSVGWVLSRTAGYLIWAEAPQLLACSKRDSQGRSTTHMGKSTNYSCVPTQSTTRVTRPLKSQLIEPKDNLCIQIHSLRKADEALSVNCSIMDWKNRLIFAAAKNFPKGEK